LDSKPKSVTVKGRKINQINEVKKQGWSWKELNKGGVLTIRHESGNKIAIVL
jgi:hypothetical protein